MKKVTKPGGLCVSGSVRLAETQDGAVLLDLRQGICFGMTPVGVRIWHLLKQECSPDQILDCLSIEHTDVPRGHIADDVTQFLQGLKSKGLLGDGEAAPRFTLLSKFLAFTQRQRSSLRQSSAKARMAHLLFWKAFLGLAAFDLFGFGSNFCRAYELVRDWKLSPSEVRTDLVVDQVCKAVNYACVWYPKRVLCLQRSVVTTCLLRHCGVSAQMAMGAQKFPFKAHAWTEVDGHPINERRDVQRFYLVWERC